jgi:uncharacterized protein with HEPN domain
MPTARGSQSSSRSEAQVTAQGRSMENIAGIGNILRHEYQRVDGQIIWKAVKNDFPPLKRALLVMKASLTNDPE